MSCKVKKIVSLVLMVCMMFSILPSNQVLAASKAKTSTAAITRGQICQMVNSLLGATVKSKEMKDIVNYKKSDKYYSVMSIAYNAGYIVPYEEDKIYKSTVKATYSFAATVLSNILETSKSKVIGKHKYSDTMTMADFKAYLSELVSKVITNNTSNKEYFGNVVVNKPDLKLSNVTVNGNLIIGDGVADQEITLNNVTITGKLIVRGGGKNSVIIMGKTNIPSMVIVQVNNAVSIKVTGDAYVQMVYINDGCKDVILKGAFGAVNIMGRGINVSTDNATISDITLFGMNTSFTLTEGTTIDNVTLAVTASKAKVDIAGNVNNILAKASNSEIKIADKGTIASITADKSATGTIINVLAGATVNAVISDAQETVLSGAGKVEKATINGDDSQVSTPDTVVTIGENTQGVQDNTRNGITPTPVDSIIPISTVPSMGGGAATFPGFAPTTETTDTPTPTTKDETAKYQTDERFEVGYPYVNLGTKVNDTTNVTISLKLKSGVASKASPAVIYYIVSTYNTSWDVSSNSIIHGHLGTDTMNETGLYHNMISCDYSGAIKVTNANIVDIPLSINNSNGEGMVTYFVIKTANTTSTVPTKIVFTSDTMSSFTDTDEPYILGTYWSDAVNTTEVSQQRTIRVFVSEALDPKSIVPGGAIKVSGINSGSITKVTIHNSSTEYSSNDNWIDLSLTYPTGIDLSNLRIEYTPSNTIGFTDLANIPNKMSGFILYRTAISDSYIPDNLFVNNATPQIEKLYVSSDGKYICFRVSPTIKFIDDYDIKINGDIWNKYQEVWDVDSYDVYCYNETGTKASSYTIEITTAESKVKFVDVMGQEYKAISKTFTEFIDSSITVTSATLDLSDKILKLTLAGNWTKYWACYACQFVVTIDGVAYRLRNEGEFSEFDDKGVVISFYADNMFDIDLSKLTSTSIATLSLSRIEDTIQKGIDHLMEVSGKPLENFTVNIAITE